MHYVGTDLKASIERQSDESGKIVEQCLVQTPRWDFNYQYLYLYDLPREEAPKLHHGDILNLRCTYTNDPKLNSKLASAIAADPLLEDSKDVELGEETLDEMCLILMGVTYPNKNKK